MREVTTVEGDNPFALDPGEKIVALGRQRSAGATALASAAAKETIGKEPSAGPKAVNSAREDVHGAQ